MSDEAEAPEDEPAGENSAAKADAAPAAPSGAPLTIAAQYTKDLSFEAPTTPQVFSAMQSQAPDISINVDVRATKLQDEAYEIVLILKAKCKVGDSVAFIVELVYGGVVTCGLPDDGLKPALLVEAPRLLFPFARNIVADVTRDAGFPPLMLSPVDFEQMYESSANGGETADLSKN